MRGFWTTLAVALSGLLLCLGGGCSVLDGRLSDKREPPVTVKEWVAQPRPEFPLVK